MLLDLATPLWENHSANAAFLPKNHTSLGFPYVICMPSSFKPVSPNAGLSNALKELSKFSFK